MIIKVNKNQFLDDYELDTQINAYKAGMHITSYEVMNNFKTEDVSIDTLLEYIKLGYGIKINC